ncbi:hypothetical protein BGZ96_004289, partial [Linnemannia gamsii]
MGATAVCDHEGRFTYFATGYVASMHNLPAYKNFGLNNATIITFKKTNYLLAEAAYTLSET